MRRFLECWPAPDRAAKVVKAGLRDAAPLAEPGAKVGLLE
jgi:hypothetical protein